MATIRQQIAAKKLSENIQNGGKKTKQQILIESGYSQEVALKPKLVTESKGFKDELEQIFPINKAHNALANIIDSNPGDPSTTSAIRLRYEVGGHLKDKNEGGQPLQSLIQININK